MIKRTLVFIGLLLLTAGAWAGVNINTATQEELEQLLGIGPVRARAIIDYRRQHGPFSDIGQLEHVQGIGPEILKQIRRDVTLIGPTTGVSPRPGGGQASRLVR